jgi:hypothetical protein
MRTSIAAGLAGLALALAATAPDATAQSALRPPLAFEANLGQTAPEVRFLGRSDGYAFFLTSTGAVLELQRSRTERAVVRMTLAGASPSPAIGGEAELPGTVSYYRSDPPRRVSGVPTYARVRYAGVYPGVDLVYHGHERRLEYDFIVAPGADPGRIALEFEGTERLTVDRRGDLVLATTAGELRQPRPLIYQEVDGARRAIPGDYVRLGPRRVGIRLGAHDPARALVIDPVLAFSTYLGGSDEESDTLYGRAARVAVDAAGNAYVTGTTASIDFPATSGEGGALDGNRDAFVTKLSPTGAVLYSTYLGGPCEDIGQAIAVDTQGNAYVTGRAHDRCSLWVPTGVLVAKLDPGGAVLYFITLGNTWADTSVGHAIAADAGGNAYVVGVAGGSPPRDFPTTPGAFRATDCGVMPGAIGGDGFVAKVNPQGTALVYSTYLCGDSYDWVEGIAVDGTGHAYVTGRTVSRNFPTRNPFQAHHAGWGVLDVNAFVARLLPDGSDLVYSTYLGGRFETAGAAIAVDGAGHAYVTGSTIADDFPTTPGVLQPVGTPPGCLGALCVTDSFVTKLSPTGSDLVYSTYLFGEGKDDAHGIAVDATGHAYIVGATGSLYFPTLDAFQSTLRGNEDAFVVKLSPDATRLVYSTYLGGDPEPGPVSALQGADAGFGIAVHTATGTVYVAGYTNSPSFPTTPGAFQPGPGGGVCFFDGTPCGDAWVSKLTAGGPGIVPPRHLIVTPAGVTPGGTITATWAGLPAPGPGDVLRLYPLGSAAGPFDEVASWPSTGAASGTLQLALPPVLLPGIHTYELRLWSGDPEFWNLPGVMARSEPIRVGAVTASADLVVDGMVTTPAGPTAGQPVQVAVTVKNQGTAAAGAFSVDVYRHRTTAPAPGTPGDAQCSVAGLAPGAAAVCTRTVTWANAGTFSLWAQIDTGQAVTESSETNNVLGPRAITVVAAPPATPDLVITALSNPPAAARPGTSFTVTDTVANASPVATGRASTTRYHLSLDGVRSGTDRLLTGSRPVPILAGSAQFAGPARTLKIPATTPPATYFVLACADDTDVIGEGNEANNCRASATTITVALPDLGITTLTIPGAAFARGASFTLSDAVLNSAPVDTAKASTTRYYLSLNGAKDPADRMLAGTRTVPVLGPADQRPGVVRVTIPVATVPGIYHVLACADDLKAVVEASEANNCRASAGTLVVTP